ncbi:MAG: restriction endonuclease subunit S [Ignavibacteria bacterium]|jgi:type I restriction enzyme S subunit|nr:restriction endonuclease subunit S [Ignavibacteria bacterium]
MEKVKLKDIATINGTTFRTNGFDEILYLDTSSVTKGVFGDFMHLSKNDKIPSRAKRAVKNNTIVYSTVRPNLEHLGIFSEPKENVVVSTGFATIDVNEKKTEPKFVYYNLTQSKFTNALHTIATNNVSSYPSINPSDLENLEITLPPLPTQKSISSVLSLLDDKIELNRNINAELEALARTLYEWYFVQNRKKEWKVEKLGEILKFEKGSEPGSSAYSDTQENENFVKFYRVGDIDGNCNTWVDKTAHDLVFVKPDDVVVTFDGSVGKMGIGLEGAISGGLQKISDPTDKFSNALIWLIFSDAKIVATIEQYATGSVLKHASGAIKYLELPIPDTTTLSAFSKVVKPIFAQIVQNRQQSAELAKLRDFLLPMLMNGEVVVKYPAN